MLTNHVSGRNMIVGEALTFYVSQHLTQIEHKYFGEMIASNVVFLKATKRLGFECSIRVTCNKGFVFTANSTQHSVYKSFNNAFSNISKQIYKKKVLLIDTKPVNHKKDKLFFEHTEPIVDPDTEIFNIPELYGHSKPS
jgi:ribosomal subunit interface protein